MTKDQLENYDLPDAPGVYFFVGDRKEILYIGKATSLRNRVRSYFMSDLAEKRSQLIAEMIVRASSIEVTETESVLEALILETNLIRTHKPKYNTRSKDDKSYNHLVITNEKWPRVLVVRGKDLTEQYTEKEIKHHFGPFPSGQLFKEALKIVRKLFKFYDTPRPLGQEQSKVARGRIDFNRQIGLYPDGESREVYLRTIRHIKLFFSGKKRQVIKELYREMMEYAKREEFEKAQNIKRRIYALEHIQDIALIKSDQGNYAGQARIRIEAYDIAHLQGKAMVGVMTVVQDGQVCKGEYRKFKIKTVTAANDTAALGEVLERRFGHTEWPLPQIIVVDGGAAQKNVAKKIVDKKGLLISVVSVVKNNKHKPERLVGDAIILKKHQTEVLLANAEAHRFAVTYHRESARKKLIK